MMKDGSYMWAETGFIDHKVNMTGEVEHIYILK